MGKRNEGFIDLSDRDEPRFASTATSTRAITLPPGAVSRVSYKYLHLSIGGAAFAVWARVIGKTQNGYDRTQNGYRTDR